MLRLNAYAVQDIYLQLVVYKVIEKVYRNTQNSCNVFVFLVAATLTFAAT
jgi:hypothetical protein